MRRPALFQCSAALNVYIFVKPQPILAYRLIYCEYDTKESIIDAKLPAKFENFTQEDNGGHTAALQSHGQHYRAPVGKVRSSVTSESIVAEIRCPM